MKYVRVEYTVNHCEQLNKVEYYGFDETTTDEKVRTFIKEKQDRFEHEVAEFLMRVWDYTEERAIWCSAVAVDWDNIEIQIICLF